MPIKILVVEDNVDVAKLLMEFLIKTGFEAKSANNAEKILKN
jgi:DNA-binding response OmpR family regulator